MLIPKPLIFHLKNVQMSSRQPSGDSKTLIRRPLKASSVWEPLQSTHHTSHITHHTSHITHHTSHTNMQSGHHSSLSISQPPALSSSQPPASRHRTIESSNHRIRRKGIDTGSGGSPVRMPQAATGRHRLANLLVSQPPNIINNH